MKNNKGSNNPSWKGGFHKKDGYVFARAEGHPKTCRKGQYVMLKRYIILKKT